MARTRRQYTRVTDAETMITDLQTKYPDELWRVIPSSIMVLGIENSKRSEKNHVLAKTKLVKGVEKAILELSNIKVRYVIELYWSDWKDWSVAQQQWIMFHELLHVHEDGDKMVKHDCEDFKLILDAAGISWAQDPSLVNMLDDKVAFDLKLRPGLDEVKDDNQESDEIPDPKPEAVEEQEEEPVSASGSPIFEPDDD